MIFSACLQLAPKILFKERDILTFNANSKSRLIDSVCMSFCLSLEEGNAAFGSHRNNQSDQEKRGSIKGLTGEREMEREGLSGFV